MNKVASPCCGSCKCYKYCESLRDFCCCKIEADPFNLATPEGVCLTSFYTPRNPIPITDVPGVKELVEAAYQAGYQEALELANLSFTTYLSVKDCKDGYTGEYMKTLTRD